MAFVEPLEVRLFLHGDGSDEAAVLMGADTAILRINVGGKAFTDPAGLVWSADQGFAGGKAVRSKFAVDHTDSDRLFTDRRQGTFTYSLPVADGTYTLSLGFVDTLKKAGQRRFNIDAEGQRLAENVDVVAGAGRRAAMALSYTVNVSGGTLDLAFSGAKKNKAILSAISVAPFVVQATPPAAPTNLAATAPSASSVSLSWSDNSGDETGFELERSSDGGATFAPVLTLPADTTGYVDSSTDIKPSQTYQYRIRSVSTAGASAWSDVAAATTPAAIVEPPPPVLPAAPTDLTATALGPTSVSLTWMDQSTDETGFVVEYAEDGGAFAVLATLPANSSSYRDDRATPGGTYAYRIRASNDVGKSAPSNAASVETLSVDSFTKITWDKRAASPIIRSEALGGALGGKLYLFGGFNGDAGPVTRSDVYDPKTNTWSPLPDLPTRLTHAGTVIDGRNFYFAGGYVGTGHSYNQTYATKDVWQYNVDTQTYSHLPDLPQARGAGGMVLLGRSLHYFGGGDLARKDRAEHFVLNLDDQAAGWTNAAPLPSPRTHLAYATLNGKIYAIGGQQGLEQALVPLSDVDIWDPASPDKWTAGTPLLKPVSHTSNSTFIAGGRIIMLGGERGDLNWLDEAVAYDPTTKKWTSLTPLPGKRFSGVGGLIDGKFYFSTGGNADTTFRGTLG
jgi:N-acetylneuraminic acid mutarotase